MKRLLQLLERDAHLTTKQLAVMLDRTEQEVTEEIAQFEKDGIIKGYKAVVDWEQADHHYVEALIELKVTPKADRGFEEIAAKIAEFSEVKSVFLMSGGFDLAVNVVGKTFQDVAMFVAYKLAVVDSVLSTATHFILKRYKYDNISFAAEEKDERRFPSL
ncbi:MAG TPA: Lrp/AsnC family transcriptional regulator [Firmicutes bacterium]|nr:Lrp/AsnC family transcriptional regulator [Bacillota bacterium]